MAKKIMPDSPIHRTYERINVRDTKAHPAFSGTRYVSSIPEDSVSAKVSGMISSHPPSNRDDVAKKQGESLISLAHPIQENTLQDKVITGLQRVAAHSLQGIPYDLLNRLKEAVNDRGAVLFTRPVEPVCSTLLDEGWPTKHFKIKAKSSNWGAQAGTIPVLQKYSKLALDSDSKIAKYSKLAKKCLNDSDHNGKQYARSVPLKISQNRLAELEQKGYLYGRNEQVSGHGVRSVYFKTRACNRDDGSESNQLLVMEPDGQWAVYDADHSPPSPIMVIAQPNKEKSETAQPMTADIDPLMEVFPLEQLDLEKQDRLPLPLISDRVVTRSVDSYRSRLQKTFQSGEISKEVLQSELDRYQELEKKLKNNFYSVEEVSGKTTFREDPDMGNVSNRTRDMVRYYDQALGRKHRVIHHNVDAHSLATDEQANYPITAFFPASLNMAEGVCMIFNQEQLLSVLGGLMDRGYAVQKNPLWKNRLNHNNFLNARASLAVSLNAPIPGVQAEELVRGLEKMELSHSPDDNHRLALLSELERYLREDPQDTAHERRDSTISQSGSSDSLSSDGESIADLSDFSEDESGSDSDIDPWH